MEICETFYNFTYLIAIKFYRGGVMRRIPYVENDHAPADVKAIYQQLEKRFGMVTGRSLQSLARMTK